MKRILILAALSALTACSRETPEEVKNAAAATNTPEAAATAGPAGDGATFTGLSKKRAPIMSAAMSGSKACS